ncbi:uncharacterized protein LOC119338108 isoform X2 [Triticum dicoccoides]|uniref:uncharacterized protein LOC119338108 isoform X2 n=1 Tax=Triticum dicoccoides TaxID=85692 RepID=UPI0018913B97|nr:uncharacterized protein LOC119338108 isoform X2 [Triticum dicoccoides]XP_037466306.1 uncharacterized protein LOC119338108 isoform X2 [Triticum dicoccoides]
MLEQLVNVSSAAVLDRRGQGSALSRSKNVRQCQVCKRQDPSAVQEIKGSIIDSAPVAVPNFQLGDRLLSSSWQMRQKVTAIESSSNVLQLGDRLLSSSWHMRHKVTAI